MNGVTQPKTPPKVFVMFGRYALLVGVPDRSHAAGAGPAFAPEYEMSESSTASSETRTITPVDYEPELGNRRRSEPIFRATRDQWRTSECTAT